MKAVGYIRISTFEQAADGASLDMQKARLMAWAAANDCELLGIQVDAGVSGARADNRRGLQAALDAACRQRAVLIVFSLSRLARSTKDAIAISERLNQAGADLISLSEKIDTTSAAGKMVFRMLAVLAEFERDIVSERTRAAMQLKRARREYAGGEAPYGWRVSGDGVTLEPNTAERSMIRKARALRSTGLSLRAVGRRLLAAGCGPRSGRCWHAKTVADLLTACPEIRKP